jgi:cytochrome c553
MIARIASAAALALVLGAGLASAQNASPAADARSPGNPAEPFAALLEDWGKENAKPDLDVAGKLVREGNDKGVTACAGCHGENGVGQAEGTVPRITAQNPFYLYKELRDYAEDRRQNEVMQPIAKALSEPQMRDLAAYYAGQDGPYFDQKGADAAKVDQGRRIARIGDERLGVQSCNNCHGSGGMGLAPVYPTIAGQFPSYVTAQLQAWKTGARNNDPGSVMKTISSHLDDAAIDALAAYFAQVRPVESAVGGSSQSAPEGASGRAPAPPG